MPIPLTTTAGKERRAYDAICQLQREIPCRHPQDRANTISAFWLTVPRPRPPYTEILPMLADFLGVEAPDIGPRVRQPRYADTRLVRTVAALRDLSEQ